MCIRIASPAPTGLSRTAIANSTLATIAAALVVRARGFHHPALDL